MKGHLVLVFEKHYPNGGMADLSGGFRHAGGSRPAFGRHGKRGSLENRTYMARSQRRFFQLRQGEKAPEELKEAHSGDRSMDDREK